MPSLNRAMLIGRLTKDPELLEPVVVEAVLQYVDNLDLAALLATKNANAAHVSTAQELATLDKREDVAADAYAAGGANQE